LTPVAFNQPHFARQYSWWWYVCAEEASS